MTYSVFEKARKNIGVVRKARRDLSEAQYLNLLKLAKRYYIDRFVKFSREDLKNKYRIKSQFITRLYNDLSEYENREILEIKSLKKEKEVNSISLQEHLQRIRQNRLDEKVKTGEASKIKEGFIYIIENPVWDGWMKAGMTLDYEERLNSYNMYDPTESYTLVRMRWISDRKKIESILLEELANHSTLRKGEWFKIDKEKALLIFNNV